jgi:transposase InsO family protein
VRDTWVPASPSGGLQRDARWGVGPNARLGGYACIDPPESSGAQPGLEIRHIRTRPYRPRTNGKAERVIRTMLGGWAYGAIYRSSQ